MSEQKQPNIIKLGLFLGIVGAISAGLLAGVAIVTKKPIEIAQQKKTNEALKEVLPPFDEILPVYLDKKKKTLKEFKAEDGTKVTFYLAEKDGKLVGIAGEGYSKKGFNGKVTVMLGLYLTGKIKTVIVTQQAETPGLGTVVTDRKREETIFDAFNKLLGKYKKPEGLAPNAILDGFDEHVAKAGEKPWAVKKDGGQFDFITGATITSRAVTDAVYNVDSTFVANQEEILKHSSLSAK